jgi:hypothetical protein
MQEELRAELVMVRSAIEKILNGAQSVSVHGKAMTYADLRTLFARADELRSQLARAQGPQIGRLV